MAVALLAMVISMGLLASVARRTAHVRRLGVIRGHALQAQQLAEAGLQRARARLAADPQYPGETWRVSAESLASTWPGSIEIRVEPSAGRTRERRVHVVADYPEHPVHRVRHAVDATVALPSQGGPVP